jgi:hypothetical protein
MYHFDLSEENFSQQFVNKSISVTFAVPFTAQWVWWPVVWF